MVVLVLNDELFKEELSKIINNYDFDRLTSINGNLSFKQLLEEW